MDIVNALLSVAVIFAMYLLYRSSPPAKSDNKAEPSTATTPPRNPKLPREPLEP